MLSFKSFLTEMDLYHGSNRGLPSALLPTRRLQMTRDADVAFGYANRDAEFMVDPDDFGGRADSSVTRFAVNKQNLPLELLPFVKQRDLDAAEAIPEKKRLMASEIRSALRGQKMTYDQESARERGVLRQIARAIGKATGGVGGRLTTTRGRHGMEININPYQRPRLPIHPTGVKYVEDDLAYDKFVPLPVSKRNPPRDWVATQYASVPAGTVLPPRTFSIKPFYRPGISVSGFRGIPLFGTKRLGL